MKELPTALARRFLPDLCSEAPREDGIRGWLQAGSFYIDGGSTADHLIVSNATLDYNPARDPIAAFCASCHSIVYLLAQASEIISQRAGSRRFGSLWNRLNASAKK